MTRSILIVFSLLSLAAGSVSGCTPSEEGLVSGECSDGLDNDDDGAIDCEDLGCLGDYDCVSAGDDDDSAL